MDYAKELEKYAPAHTDAQVAKEVAKIKMAANRNGNIDVYKFCYSVIDLTTLSCNDSVESVQAFARKAVEFYQKYPNIPNVASICVYPPFVERKNLPLLKTKEAASLLIYFFDSQFGLISLVYPLTCYDNFNK